MMLYDAAVMAVTGVNLGVRRPSMQEGVCIVPRLGAKPSGILVAPTGEAARSFVATVDDLTADDWETAHVP